LRIALFITCLGETFYPRAGIAVVRVLEHLGHRIEFPKAQTCCGQPMLNNGYQQEAAALARRMIAIFERYDAVVTPSGSCAAMVREQFHRLLADDIAWAGRADALASRTFEFVEFLSKVLKVDLAALGVRWEGSVTCHTACHLRPLGLAGEGESLLRKIPGVRLTPLDGAEQCCGFGGMFAVKYPQISGGMVADKVANIHKTGCPVVVCSEAGCGMNIEGACRRAGHAPQFISIAEIIAEGLGLLAREERS
jgi:L-lactate dehydrogenase complex protein LldE